MLGWPSTDWSECPSSRPPLSADWVLVPGLVRHTFTHFNLELNIYRAIIKRSLDPYFFIPLKNFNSSDMPTVMRKAYDLYLISED
jgi:A/G-specific adenine glycosylase